MSRNFGTSVREGYALFETVLNVELLPIGLVWEPMILAYRVIVSSVIITVVVGVTIGVDMEPVRICPVESTDSCGYLRVTPVLLQTSGIPFTLTSL